MRTKITETLCRKALSPTKIWDTEIRGFGLFVGKRTATFYYQFAEDGKTQRVKIGRYPTVNATDAREVADRLHFGRRRDVAKTILVDAPTLQEALNAYMARPKLRSSKNKDVVRGMIKNHLGDWLNKPLNEITRAMAVERHRKMRKTPVAANHTLRTFRTIWRHANRTTNLGESPTVAIEWNAETPDGRVIEDLKEWNEIVGKLDNLVHRAYYHFLLRTGLRKMECASLKWEQIGKDALRIDETKSGRPFELALTPEHHAVLEPMRGLERNPPPF